MIERKLYFDLLEYEFKSKVLTYFNCNMNLGVQNEVETDCGGF